MYKNQTQNNIQKQPYISLQKLRENKFVRGVTTLVGVIVGIIGAYQIAKSTDSFSPEADAAEIQKNLNTTKSIESVLTEEQLKEHQPVPYVLLGSQVVGMQTITSFTKEDKGNIASLEHRLHGDNFNKYVSPLEEKASSIEDEIVISYQGEIFKIKTGKIDSAKYLVGIKKIGEISKYNMKMSDSERKVKLVEILNSYQNDSESDTPLGTDEICGAYGIITHGASEEYVEDAEELDGVQYEENGYIMEIHVVTAGDNVAIFQTVVGKVEEEPEEPSQFDEPTELTPPP